jgi:CMP-N-acetylneuraminic acid synthetase
LPTPESLATDGAGKIDTILDLLEFEEKRKGGRYDYVLDLDITSPLRTIEDLTESFNMLAADSNALNIFSVNHAAKNPYFNMVERKENGAIGLVKKGNFLTRQSATPVYELNASFYFYRRAFFEQADKKVINDNCLIYIMPHICFDLDHPVDFEFMSFLIEHNKLNFSF